MVGGSIVLDVLYAHGEIYGLRSGTYLSIHSEIMLVWSDKALLMHINSQESQILG